MPKTEGYNMVGTDSNGLGLDLEFEVDDGELFLGQVD